MASHERQFLTDRVSRPKFKELYAIGEEATTLALALALALLFCIYRPMLMFVLLSITLM